jgi:hypothetical protein
MIEHSIKMGFLNAGTLRAIGEMSLGISMFTLYEYLSKKTLSKAWRVALSLLEVYAIYRFFALTLWQPVGLDNFRRLIYIMIIVLLSFLNVTAVTRVLNRPFARWLGSMSFIMYIAHYPLITIFMKALADWKLKLLTSGDANSLAIWKLIQDTGGYDSSGRIIEMTGMDMILYIGYVLAVAIAIKIVIALSGVAFRQFKAYRAQKLVPAEQIAEPGEPGEEV